MNTFLLDKLPKEEKNKLFKDKMRECGVTATWKWEDVERILPMNQYGNQ